MMSSESATAFTTGTGFVKLCVTDGTTIVRVIAADEWYADATCVTTTIGIGTWNTVSITAPKIVSLQPPPRWFPEWQPKWRPAASRAVMRPARVQARACRKQAARWKRRRFVQRLSAKIGGKP
jgi:hypothetical protein